MPGNFVAVVEPITDMLSPVPICFHLNVPTLSRAVLHKHTRPRVSAPVIHQLQSGRRVSVSVFFSSIEDCEINNLSHFGHVPLFGI
jgi:hypothetical protein